MVPERKLSGPVSSAQIPSELSLDASASLRDNESSGFVPGESVYTCDTSAAAALVLCSQKVVSLNKIAMKSADTKGEHDEKIHRKVGGLAP
jgi:hypothetical protein